jgi:hypothetical protein
MGRWRRVLWQPVDQVDERFLEDVGHIDASPEPAVEPQLDHLAQPRAVASPQGSERRTVAGCGAPNEFGVVQMLPPDTLLKKYGHRVEKRTGNRLIPFARGPIVAARRGGSASPVAIAAA